MSIFIEGISAIVDCRKLTKKKITLERGKVKTNHQ